MNEEHACHNCSRPCLPFEDFCSEWCWGEYYKDEQDQED